MAGQDGKKQYDVKPPVIEMLRRTGERKKYFYVDGELYRTIKGDRANDILRAWSYDRKCVVDFVWSDVKRHMQQAYSTAEVAKLLNRQRKTIFEYLRRGYVNPPTRIGEQKHDDPQLRFGYFKWSEDDVLALHAHLLTVGTGRPRKDGMLTAAPRLPSRMELIAMMKQNRMIYVQTSDGSFVPIFEQAEFS